MHKNSNCLILTAALDVLAHISYAFLVGVHLVMTSTVAYSTKMCICLCVCMPISSA